MRKYQVVFFGTSEFAVPALNSLLESQEIEVNAIVSQPDKPTGRHQELTPTPIKAFVAKTGIPVLQPESLKKNSDFEELLRNLEPDLFVVVSYGQIIPKRLLEIPKFGALNVHGSLLPRYRGASPIQQSLLSGDTQTGITIIKINEKMDEGPILFIKRMPIEETDTFETLYAKLAALGGEFIAPVALDYIDETLGPIPQDHSRATYCEKIEKEDGRINWKVVTAEEIHNRIRAFTPWPGCFTIWNGKRLKILKTKVQADAKEKAGVMKIHTGESAEKELWIGTKHGALIAEKLQIEGKGEMDAKTFINGYSSKIQEVPELSN